MKKLQVLIIAFLIIVINLRLREYASQSSNSDCERASTLTVDVGQSVTTQHLFLAVHLLTRMHGTSTACSI